MRLPGPRAVCLIVAVLALAAQLPGLSGEFIWDDVPLFQRSDLYLSTERLSEALQHSLGKETFYWRPLATTSFLLESLLHGGAVWGFRLTGALLHAGTAFLACAVLQRLLGVTDGTAQDDADPPRTSLSAWCAFLAATAYALHPVTVETVTWPSGRFDGLVGLLIMATLACLVGAPSASALSSDQTPMSPAASRARLIGVGVFSALAMLTKENALLLPGLVWLWDRALRPPPQSQDWVTTLRTGWQSTLASATGVLAVLVVRADVLGYVLKTRPQSVEAAGTGLDHVLLIGRALGTYLIVLVQPFGTVGPLHHAGELSASDPLGWLGVLVGLTLIGGAGWLVWKRRAVGFVLAALLLAVLPVSQLVPLDLSGGLHAADRFLYLPAFFAIGAAALGARTLLGSGGAWREKRRVVGWSLAAWLVAFAGYRAFVLLPHWSSAERFWKWAHVMSPESDVSGANLFEVYWKQGKFTEAEALARQLVRDKPDGRYQPLLARVVAHQGDGNAGVAELTLALNLKPDVPELLVERGRLLLNVRRSPEAYADFQRALEVLEQDDTPRFMSVKPQALAGVAVAAVFSNQNVGRAPARVREALALVEKGDHAGWRMIAWAQIALQDADGASEALSHLPQLSARELVNLIALAAAKLPDAGVAAELKKRAEAIGLSSAVIGHARAEGFMRGGEYHRADITYRELQDADPKDWGAAFARWKLAFEGSIETSAVELARRLTEIRPESSEAWDTYGYTLYREEDVQGAEAALRKAVALDAKDAEARFHLGMLFLRTERKELGFAEIATARVDAVRSRQDDLVRRIDAALQ